MIFILCLSSSWILWRCSPRPERYHRVSWFPPRLPQLRQLYVADNNRGEKQNPANLRHAGAGGRLWYCISLRWTTVAWQPKNEVRNNSFIYILIFFPAPGCSVSLFSLNCSPPSSPIIHLHGTKYWHLDNNIFYFHIWAFDTYPRIEMTQWLWSHTVSALIWVDFLSYQMKRSKKKKKEKNIFWFDKSSWQKYI